MPADFAGIHFVIKIQRLFESHLYLVPAKSPVFLVHAMKSVDKKKRTNTGLESCLQNLHACIIDSSGDFASFTRELIASDGAGL